MPAVEGKAVVGGRGTWRALLGKEARYLVVSLRNGLLGGFLSAFAIAFVFCLYSLWSAPEFAEHRGVCFLVAAGYAIYLGSIGGAVLGIAFLAWRAVRAWILVPLALIPATLWLAVWLSSGFLANQLFDVFDALRAAAQGRTMLVGGLGHAAHAGPIILVIALPLLLIDIGALSLHPGVLWQLAILAAEVFVVLAAGTIPGALVSTIALGVAYVRGFRRRHADQGGSTA